MSGWFAEKISQVEPSTLTAFGIRLESRYGELQEIRELLGFAEECARRGVDRLVMSACYDSKACLCTFELDECLAADSPEESAILEAAREHIAQFLWRDVVISDRD